MKKTMWFTWTLIAGFLLAYVSLCFNNNIWTDEGFTIDLLRTSNSMAEAIHGTVIDVHPPLYYIILRLVTNVLGRDLLLLKIMSVIPMVLSMVFGSIFVRKHYGEKASLLYVLILGVIPCCMEYAVQVRMYSWAILFLTLCGIGVYETFYDGRLRYMVLMVLSGIAAAYTHYFALVAVGVLYGFIFLSICATRKKETFRKKLLVFAGLTAASLIGYAPWLSVLFRQVRGVSNNYWIGEIDLETVISYFGWLFGTDLPYMTLLFSALWLLAILLLASRIRHEKDRTAIAALLAMGVPVLTALAGITVSLLMRPIFIARYLVPCLSLFAFFFAVAFSKLSKKTYFALLSFLFMAGVISYEHNFDLEYKSTYVEATEQFLKENVSDNDLIAYNFQGYGFIYEYYWNKEQLCYIEDVDFTGAYDTIWLLQTHNYAPIPYQKMEENGWSIEYKGNYGIEHDEFKIYRIFKQ